MSQTPPIAIIAGNGSLPLEVAEALVANGQDIFICAIADEVDDKIKQFPHEVLEWGQIGHLFKLLKAHKVKQLVLAGGVVGRPDFSITKIDLGTALTLPSLLGAMLGGDNTILSSIISIFEKRGFEVCNIADLLPELVVHIGTLTQLKPKSADRERITVGAAVTQALGKFDVGQGCVVIGRRAVALEGVEGTDAMLERVASMREIGRLPQKRGGVLVKSMKPDQDQRADLPTIGPGTIEAVSNAGLNGVAVQGEKTLIVNKVETLRLAKKLKIFIYGFDGENIG